MGITTISVTRMALLTTGLVLLAFCLSGSAWAKGYVYITYTGTDSGSPMYCVDANNYSLASTTNTNERSVMAASPDGRWIFLAGSRNIAGINTTADPASSMQKSIPFDGTNNVRDMLVDGDDHIYLAISPQRIHVYDGDSGDMLDSLFMSANPRCLALSPGDDRLYVAACLWDGVNPYDIPDYNISIYNAGTLDHIRTKRVDMVVDDIVVSPDGASLYVLGHRAATGNKSTKLLKLRTSDLTTQRTAYGPNTYPMDMVVSPDGSRVYVCEGDGKSILVFNGATLALERTVYVGDLPRILTISPDGKKVYIAGDNDEFRVIDTGSYEVTHTVMGSMSLPRDIAYVNVPSFIQGYILFNLTTITPRPSISLIFSATPLAIGPTPTSTPTGTTTPGPVSPVATATPMASPGEVTISAIQDSPTPTPGATSGASSTASTTPTNLPMPGFMGYLAMTAITVGALSILRSHKR